MTTATMTACTDCAEIHCGCDQVVACCNTCLEPIFGREDYAMKFHNAAPYSYRTFTCPDCLEAKQEAAA